MTKFTTVEQVWKAIDEGKTVCWANPGYVLTIEDSNLDWRKEQGFAVPFSNRDGKCLRVTFKANYFGSSLLESELSRLFLEADSAEYVDIDPMDAIFSGG